MLRIKIRETEHKIPEDASEFTIGQMVDFENRHPMPDDLNAAMMEGGLLKALYEHENPKLWTDYMVATIQNFSDPVIDNIEGLHVDTIVSLFSMITNAQFQYETGGYSFFDHAGVTYTYRSVNMEKDNLAAFIETAEFDRKMRENKKPWTAALYVTAMLAKKTGDPTTMEPDLLNDRIKAFMTLPLSEANRQAFFFNRLATIYLKNSLMSTEEVWKAAEAN